MAVINYYLYIRLIAISPLIQLSIHILQTRISEWFLKNTERYLNDEALRYLGMKVMNLEFDTSDDLDIKQGVLLHPFFCRFLSA